jgi:hypothetical protein
MNTYHQVDIEEFVDYSFDSVICASSKEKKRLTLQVTPYTKSLVYKLYVNKELVESIEDMHIALEAYNSI